MSFHAGVSFVFKGLHIQTQHTLFSSPPLSSEEEALAWRAPEDRVNEIHEMQAAGTTVLRTVYELNDTDGFRILFHGDYQQ